MTSKRSKAILFAPVWWEFFRLFQTSGSNFDQSNIWNNSNGISFLMMNWFDQNEWKTSILSLLWQLFFRVETEFQRKWFSFFSKMFKWFDQNEWKTSSFVTVVARGFTVSRRNFRNSWMKKCAIDLNRNIMNDYCLERLGPKQVKNLKFCHCCGKRFCGVETEFQKILNEKMCNRFESKHNEWLLFGEVGPKKVKNLKFCHCCA